jgi:OFA family oxalate/formate antiporter-like MFS transporter
VGGSVLSSFTKSLEAFLFFYGVMTGIGSGICYMVPMVCAWEHFPNNKGFATGVNLGAYGMGSFIFTRVAS